MCEPDFLGAWAGLHRLAGQREAVGHTASAPAANTFWPNSRDQWLSWMWAFPGDERSATSGMEILNCPPDFGRYSVLFGARASATKRKCPDQSLRNWPRV